MTDPKTPSGERAALLTALQDSEERYRMLFDAIPLAAILYDTESFDLLAANDAALSLFGYQRDQLQSLRFFDLLLPEEHERLLRLSQDKSDLTLGGFWKTRRRDGTVLEVEVKARSTFEAGRQSRVFVARDVTERRRLESALRDNEERFRVAFQTSPDAVTLMRAGDGVYVAVNQGFIRLTGWSEQEALGRNYRQLDLWDDLTERDQLFEQLAAQGEIRNRETRLRTKTGQVVVAQLSCTRVQAAQQYILVVARDVTELRRAQEEQFQLQEQLRHAQKMEAVGRLAGGVAHDFNNMMTVVTNFAEFLLADVPPDSHMRDDLRQILEASRRATTLTRQLLAFSRKQLLQPRVVDPNKLVQDVEKMLRRLIGDQIELACVLGDAVPPIHVDPSQLEQVLFNLVVNSRDAMPEGGKLTVETARQRLGPESATRIPQLITGDYVRLSVRDTGHGMDEETRRRAFEPFFTTKGRRGTGLGLATVYGIVQQCGGYILLDSTPGKGTCFDILLPAAQGEQPEEAQHAAVIPKPPDGATVLLVEDEPLVREAARAALLRSGYKVLAADSVPDALRLARDGQSRIDLLLTDVVMPGLDGRSVAREVLKVRPGLRVLFMSGYADDAIVSHGIVDSTIAFIEKPFTQERLARKIFEVLTAQTGASTAEA